MGASLLAMRPHSDEQSTAQTIAAAHLQAGVPVDRLAPRHRLSAARQPHQQLMTKPAMVGMAVGVVENGRITFLKGYGETLEGSGDPVTPETVFRWASTSKGVAATMVAKLAEQGKIDLERAGRQLCAGPQASRRQRISRQRRRPPVAPARPLPRMPTTTSSRKVRTRACSAPASRQLNAICPPGHLLVVPERRL